MEETGEKKKTPKVGDLKFLIYILEFGWNPSVERTQIENPLFAC